jgi:BirA family biotin operon repressor/biotin-[acetyl-CoA-carboxylase] ligase
VYKIPANNLFVGRNLIYVPECHSTNTLLAGMLQREPVPDGTVVIASHQTAGRGQRGNSWESEPGANLTFSLLVQPRFVTAQRQFVLTEWVAIAVAETLDRFIPGVAQIKWPNDVLLTGKKAAGILIENVLSGTVIGQSMVGIGLNVNQQSFSVAGATSMSLVTNRFFDLNDVLQVLLEVLEKRFLEVRAGHEMKAAYLRRLFGLRQVRRFRDGDGLFSGVIEGVSPEGKLRVQREGSIHHFANKEIEFVFDDR